VVAKPGMKYVCDAIGDAAGGAGGMRDCMSLSFVVRKLRSVLSAVQVRGGGSEREPP
jgi:hypothetical protein